MAKKAKQAHNGRPQQRMHKEVAITPRNKKQSDYIRKIDQNIITLALGSAGSGKTHLAALMALKYLREGRVERIVVCRPATQAAGEDLGFLPGGVRDKMDPYLQPIFQAFKQFLSYSELQQMIREEIIEIVPVAFARGRTFNHAFVLLDEAQNLTMEAMLMMLTRLGDNSKIVITGDPQQRDVFGDTLDQTVYRLRSINDVAIVHFEPKDVVRHPLVEAILMKWEETTSKNEVRREENRQRMNGKRHSTVDDLPAFIHAPVAISA